MTSLPRHANRRGSFAVFVVLALLLVASAGAVAFYMGMETKDETADLITHRVERDSFKHIVLEHGEVESSKNVEVICNVKSRNRDGTAILWVVDEGTWVKKGEKLVELDASGLEQEIKQQRIVVNTSQALKISAGSALEQAIVAKEEYLEGEFIKQEKTLESLILEMKEKLVLAGDNARFSEELAAQGFVTQGNLRADKFAVEKAQVDLDLADNNLKTLRNITKRKELIGFDSQIETARAKNEAEIKSHQEELDKLAEIEEQLKLCVIYAPEDGQVVHANRFSSRGGSAEFVVEPGALVRERQAIIRLPDPANMQVKAKINESKVSLVTENMPVRIKIGAFEEDGLEGVVKKVNKYAEPSNWFSSQVKEYSTTIQIIDPPSDIRTGMTAEVQIFVEELDDVLQIPVQALINHRAHYFCLLLKNGVPQTVEVEIGPTDDKMVVIEKGLDSGDVVVMNPKKHDTLLNLPDLPEPEADKNSRRGKRPVSPGAGRPAGNGRPAAGRPGAGRPGAGRPGGGAAGRPGAGRPSAGRPGGGGAGRPGAGRPGAGQPGGTGRPAGAKPATGSQSSAAPTGNSTTADATASQPAEKQLQAQPADSVEKQPEATSAENVDAASENTDSDSSAENNSNPSRGGASVTGAGE